MSKYSTLLYRVYHWAAKIPPKISWSNKHAVTDDDRKQIAEKLASGYYVILTGNKSHLSSVIVSLLSWIKTGKWAKYSHALMNCDNIMDPAQHGGFKFVEADVKGVVYTTFDEVFACDYVCLLSPANIENGEWTTIIDALINQIGKPYDDLFDLADSTRVSCVEVVLNALEASNNDKELIHLKLKIAIEGNLIPQMYRDCVDFGVVYEKI